MSYQSPITMYKERIIKDIVEKQDGYLMEEVRKVGFDIDKEELAKALKYDRDQYMRGYEDGRMYKPPAITHADRIRAMSNEGLADWIAQILTYHTRASSDPYKDECEKACPLYKCCNDQPSDNIEEWLKSPVEVQDGN